MLYLRTPMDRTGYALGTLATREGVRVVPALDPRPLLTMDDMGMGGMSHDMSGMDHGQMAGMDNSGEMMSMDGSDAGQRGTSPRQWITAVWPVWIIP
jgi:FtsP/CotA-like multicopper oxidase with cupredoxin domain